MPELPEVEILKRYSSRTMLHRQITNVRIKGKELLTCSPVQLKRKLTGKSFSHSARFGKYLFLCTSDQNCLVLHFGLTGSLKCLKAGQEELPYTKLRIDFADRRFIDYTDVRKFGEIGMTSSVDNFVQVRKLGPDALTIDRKGFLEIISRHRGTDIKSLLMDQHGISGIGNIYSDEILFQSGIHPLKRVGRLTAEESKTLFRNLSILRTAIRCKANTAKMPRRFLIHRREEGKPCPKCKTAIKRLKFGMRSSYYCPVCQHK